MPNWNLPSKISQRENIDAGLKIVHRNETDILPPYTTELVNCFMR